MEPHSERQYLHFGGASSPPVGFSQRYVAPAVLQFDLRPHDDGWVVGLSMALIGRGLACVRHARPYSLTSQKAFFGETFGRAARGCVIICNENVTRRPVDVFIVRDKD